MTVTNTTGTYFGLKKAITLNLLDSKRKTLFAFKKGVPTLVEDPDTIENFRRRTDVLYECTQQGIPIHPGNGPAGTEVRKAPLSVSRFGKGPKAQEETPEVPETTIVGENQIKDSNDRVPHPPIPTQLHTQSQPAAEAQPVQQPAQQPAAPTGPQVTYTPPNLDPPARSAPQPITHTSVAAPQQQPVQPAPQMPPTPPAEAPQTQVVGNPWAAERAQEQQDAVQEFAPSTNPPVQVDNVEGNAPATRIVGTDTSRLEHKIKPDGDFNPSDYE